MIAGMFTIFTCKSELVYTLRLTVELY